MDRREAMSAFASVVLAASLPVTWGVAEHRRSAAADEKAEALGNETVDRRRSTSDFDGDGVLDSRDRCPRRPETENGFQDDDGCPDVVATTGAS